MTVPRRGWRPDGRPPETLPAGPIRLRRFTFEDLGQLNTVIAHSRAHLAPWQDWARTSDVASLRGFLLSCESGWNAGTDFAYGLRDREGVIVGGAGLHARQGPHAMEIGYWVGVDHINRGFATAAARALSAAAFTLGGVRRVEIHCDEANVRSAAVPRKLGYRLDRLEEQPPEAPNEIGRGMIWVLESLEQLLPGGEAGSAGREVDA